MSTHNIEVPAFLRRPRPAVDTVETLRSEINALQTMVGDLIHAFNTYSKNAEQRAIRTETRLCALMAHQGLAVPGAKEPPR